MSGHGCPVLHELEVTEDYQPEHENPPVLSGGDYDIAAIRDCAENCAIGAMNRELARSRDEWRRIAVKNAERVEARQKLIDAQIERLRLLEVEIKALRGLS